MDNKIEQTPFEKELESVLLKHKKVIFPVAFIDGEGKVKAEIRIADLKEQDVPKNDILLDQA